MSNNWNERLKKCRLRKKMTLDVLSKKTNISKQTLIKYEKGVASPSLDSFVSVCEALSTSPNYIIYGRDENIVYKQSLQDEVLMLSLLFHSGKIQYNMNETMIKIVDEELSKSFKYAIWGLKNLNINRLEDFRKFADMISKM